VDAKGDLISATANDTPARLAVGSNGETLVADSSTSTGLRYQSNFAAGKNKVINGDFGVWQRGTSFTSTATGFFYSADRWRTYAQSGTSATISRQTFTPGTAPVAGYEGSYFARVNDTGGGVTFYQPIEDVRTFAGQTVTISFWIKATSTSSVYVNLDQYFGSGGSTNVSTNAMAASNTTTSWVRRSATVALPSIAGKTIGTNSYLELQIIGSTNVAIDIWGVQLEASNTATAFQTATGTLQGELAACQRYYIRYVPTGAYNILGDYGNASSTTNARVNFSFPVTMRIAPTTTDYATLAAYDGTNILVISSATLALSSAYATGVDFTVTGAIQFRGYVCLSNNSTSAYIGFSAEL
jgi:hypothetical protein